MKQILVWLLLLHLTGCNSNYPPIEADDFGFPKFTINAAGYNITGTQDKQLSDWFETNYKYNGDPAVIMVYNPGNNNSIWTSWGCRRDSSLCNNGQSYPTCSLVNTDNISESPYYVTQASGYYTSNNASIAIPKKYSSPSELPIHFYSTGFDKDNNPIFDSYYSAPCNFTKGLGLYFLLTKPSNKSLTNPNILQNVNRMPSSAGFFTYNLWQPTGMYQNGEKANGIINKYLPTAPTSTSYTSPYINGRLFLKILDRYYDDNGGNFQISIKRGFSPVQTPPIATIIRYVQKVMNNASETIFNEIVVKYKFRNLVKTVLVIYLAIQGLLYLTGVLNMNHKELFYSFLRIIIVGQLLATTTCWSLFNNYFFKMFTGGLDQLIGIICSAILGSGESGLTFFDKMLQIFFSYETSTKILSLLVSFPCGFIVIIMIYIGILLFVICIGKAVVLYLLSYMAISLLISLGPVFITFMLFSKTREIFESWVNQFANYFFQPLLVFAFLNVMGETIITQFNRLLGFKACFTDWLVAGNGFVLSQMWQTCVSGFADSIPVPAAGFWNNANPTKFYNAFEYYAYRYIDVPFLDPVKDLDLIKAFQNPYQGLNGPMLLNGLIYLLLCYLMYKFYDNVADIGKEIAGTASTQNTGNALNNASSSIYKDFNSAYSQINEFRNSALIGREAKKVQKRATIAPNYSQLVSYSPPKEPPVSEAKKNQSGSGASVSKANYHEVLGVSKDASFEEIRKAYKGRALKDHPDKGGDPNKFHKVSEAYQALVEAYETRTQEQLTALSSPPDDKK